MPRDGVPSICVDFAALTRENLDPQEGFVLSRVNGEWDVQSILKLCPMGEDEAMLIFARLLDRKLIRLGVGTGGPGGGAPRLRHSVGPVPSLLSSVLQSRSGGRL